MNTPFNELLAHLMTNLESAKRKAMKEQTDYYMEFISRLNSNPQSKEDMKNVKRFMKEIQPKREQIEEKPRPAKEYKWPERVQKKIEERERRMKEDQMQS